MSENATNLNENNIHEYNQLKNNLHILETKNKCSLQLINEIIKTNIDLMTNYVLLKKELEKSENNLKNLNISYFKKNQELSTLKKQLDYLHDIVDKLEKKTSLHEVKEKAS